VASCQAYRAFYRTHRPLFDNYKPGATADAARLRALMQAGQTLLRSSAEHEQSVGAVVLGRGLYAMAWARAPGRAPFRRALSDTYRRTGNGALRYLTLDILCDDGGTSDFHGDAALAELILRAAGTDPDARVRSEALTCIQYKVHRVRAPTAAELRRWFAMERSVRGNQQAIIEIAARLKRVRLVADLCARYKEQHGRPTSTCTAVLSALGVPR